MRTKAYIYCSLGALFYLNFLTVHIIVYYDALFKSKLFHFNVSLIGITLLLTLDDIILWNDDIEHQLQT